MPKPIKLKPQFRTFAALSARAAGAEQSDTLEFSFSSEEPVSRWFGEEILSHEKGAADLSRLNDGGNLLWGHDPDQVIGVLEKAWLGDDKKMRAQIRWGTSERAAEIRKDVEAGVIRNVSFGYRIIDMICTNPSAKGEDPKYLATKWMPYEVSFVSIPADQTVGVGRGGPDEELEVNIKNQQGEKSAMTEQERKELEAKMRAEAEEKANAKVAQAEKAAAERVLAIHAMGEKFASRGGRELSKTLLEGAKSLDEARAAFLELAGAKQKPVVENEAMLDLTEKDQKSYSLIRAINAQLTGDWKKAGFERECSDEISKKMQASNGGFFMPLNIAFDGAAAKRALETRAQFNSGAGNTGGYLVATELMADSFIELLRAKMLVRQLGARVLSGLVGNIDIPKQSTAATLYWVAEGSDVTESEGTFGKVSMTPKTAGARSQMTRQMLMQSTPDIEMLARADLALVMALGFDKAAISGTGSAGQPTGILNVSGIGSVAMGTNGAAFSNVDPLIDLETAVADANADFGNLAYLTNPTQVGKLKKLKDSQNNYLWNGFRQPIGSAVPGEINGYACGRSTQVPKTLAKGNSGAVCSAMIFGNWSDLLIGQWGPGLEVLANPFGAGFNSGSVDIRALGSIDIAVRHAESFAAITDLL